MKLDEKSSYLTTFTYQCGKFRYKRLPFGAALTGDMFQRKIDKIYLKTCLRFFGIADDILVVGYDRDGKDHNETAESTTNMQTSEPQTK